MGGGGEECMNEMEYALRIKELSDEAISLAEDESICLGYKIFLFSEILSKPRYNRMSIKVKHIRMILDELKK